MRNTQKEIFLNLGIIAKMVAERPIEGGQDEGNYKEIIEKLLNQDDIKLLREQNLYYLVQN